MNPLKKIHRSAKQAGTNEHSLWVQILLIGWRSGLSLGFLGCAKGPTLLMSEDHDKG